MVTTSTLDRVERTAKSWTFLQDDGARWRWELSVAGSRVVVRSAARFDTRDECVRDAANYGYGASQGAARN